MSNNSLVQISEPEYTLIQEPSNGKPEFFVAEVSLPGVVSVLNH